MISSLQNGIPFGQEWVDFMLDRGTHFDSWSSNDDKTTVLLIDPIKNYSVTDHSAFEMKSGEESEEIL